MGFSAIGLSANKARARQVWASGNAGASSTASLQRCTASARAPFDRAARLSRTNAAPTEKRFSSARSSLSPRTRCSSSSARRSSRSWTYSRRAAQCTWMSALRPPGISTARFVTGTVMAAATTAGEGSGGAGTSSAKAGVDAARAAAAQTPNEMRAGRKNPLAVTRSSYAARLRSSKESARKSGAWMWYAAAHARPGSGHPPAAGNHGQTAGSGGLSVGPRADPAFADALSAGGSARGDRGDRSRRRGAPQGGARRPSLPGGVPGPHRPRGGEVRLRRGLWGDLRQARPPASPRLRGSDRLRVGRSGEELGAHQGGRAKAEGSGGALGHRRRARRAPCAGPGRAPDGESGSGRVRLARRKVGIGEGPRGAGRADGGDGAGKSRARGAGAGGFAFR